jgi:outer membrane protein TolC
MKATLRQLLFDFNHTVDTVREARHRESAADAALLSTERDLVRGVKRAFYDCVRADRLVTVNQSGVKNRRGHLETALTRFKHGVGLAADALNAQRDLALDIQRLTRARTDASIARVLLNVQMGTDPRTPLAIRPASEPPLPSNDAQTLFNLALEHRSELIQGRATVASREAALRAATTSSAPTVAGVLEYTGQDNRFYPQSLTYTAAVQVNWPLFDGGAARGRVEQARANLEEARSDLKASRQRVLSDVAQAWLNERDAEMRLATGQATLGSAEESLRIAETRFRVGLGLYLEVEDAQAALLRVRTDLVNLQSDVDVARANLWHAIGMAPARANQGLPSEPSK